MKKIVVSFEKLPRKLKKAEMMYCYKRYLKYPRTKWVNKLLATWKCDTDTMAAFLHEIITYSKSARGEYVMTKEDCKRMEEILKDFAPIHNNT